MQLLPLVAIALALAGAADSQEPASGTAPAQPGSPPGADVPPPSPAERGAGFSMDDVLGEGAEPAAKEPSRGVLVGGYLSESLRLDTQDPGESGAAFFDAWSRAFMFMEASIGVSTKFRLSVGVDQLTPVTRDGTAPQYSTDVSEAYVSHAWSRAQLKVGLQVVSWGVMDADGPEDRINAHDHRYSIVKASEQGLHQVPQLAGRALVPLGDAGTLDLVFVPLSQPDRFIVSGGDFALLRPGLSAALLSGFRAHVASELPPASQQPYLQVADGIERLLGGLDRQAGLRSGALASFERAARYGPADFEGGVRLSGSRGPFGFSVAGLAAHERLPRIRVSSALKSVFFGLPPLTSEQALAFTASLPDQLDARFLRYRLAGGDLSVRIGPFAVKAEVAYRTAATSYTSTLDPVSRPRLETAVHVEYLDGRALAIILEGVVDHVFGDTASLAFTAQDAVRLLGRVSLSLLREKLELRLEGAYEAAFLDYYVGPSVEYFLTDRASVGLGAEIYGGPPADVSYDQLRAGDVSHLRFGVFSYYRDDSFVFTKLKYGF